MFEQGTYVTIVNVVLQAEERRGQLPEDTKKVPYKLWAKGFACDEGKLGDTVTIETVTGRKIRGQVTCISPCYTHSYGEVMPELMAIGKSLRSLLEGENDV